MKRLIIMYTLVCILCLSGCKALNGSLTVKHNSGAEIKVSDEGLEVTLPESKCIEMDSFGACVEMTIPVTEDKDE